MLRSSKTCGPVPLDTKKVISKSIKRVFNDENFDNVENKKPKIGDRNHVVDSRIKITSQAADEVLISNTKMKNEIYGLFKKVFNDLDPSNVHNYYFCREKNCKEICSADLKAMSKDNKFQHKWLFDQSYSFCENTTKWNLVYIEGESMFCAVCREFDAKQKKNFDTEKGQTDTVFLDCSDLLSYSLDSLPNADAIVACITKKFEELNIEISKLRAFVSDGASVMVGVKGGAASKLREDFRQTMINIHCICHRLALACGDTGDNYKFIKKVEENLIELWNFFKNSSKRLHIYEKVALKSKQFERNR